MSGAGLLCALFVCVLQSVFVCMHACGSASMCVSVCMHVCACLSHISHNRNPSHYKIWKHEVLWSNSWLGLWPVMVNSIVHVLALCVCVRMHEHHGFCVPLRTKCAWCCLSIQHGGWSCFQSRRWVQLECALGLAVEMASHHGRPYGDDLTESLYCSSSVFTLQLYDLAFAACLQASMRTVHCNIRRILNH